MSEEHYGPTNAELRNRLLSIAYNQTQRSNSRVLHAAIDRIRDLTEALEDALKVRPANWDDDEDPEQVEAWEAVEAALKLTRGEAPMTQQPAPAAIHNEAASRLIREMWALTGNTSALNVLAESLLVGVGMLNYPGDPRRQALIVQEVADAAQDRAKAVQPMNPRKAP